MSNTNIPSHEERFTDSKLDPDYLNLIETLDHTGRLLGQLGEPLPGFDPEDVKELRVKVAEQDPQAVYYHIEQLLRRAQVRIRIEETGQREYEYIADYLADRIQGVDVKTSDGRRTIEQVQVELVELIELLAGYDKGRLAGLLEDISAKFNIPVADKHLEEIRAERREIIERVRQGIAYQRILREAQEREPEDGGEYLQQQLDKLKSRTYSYEFATRTAPPALADLERLLADQPQVLKTGYELTLGAREPVEINVPAGALTIVAGSTGHGKTTFLINLLLRLQERYKDKRFYLLTYEEPSQALLVKILNTYQGEEVSGNNRRSLQHYLRSREDGTKYFRDRSLEPYIEEKALEFAQLITEGRIGVIDVDDTSDKLKAFIEYLGKREDTGAVLIDYIQLIRPGGDTRYNTRQEELKKVCIEMKEAAVHTALPVILGAQFNRTVGSQADLEATRIGEAGDIERVANLILALYNNNYPAKDEKVLGKLEEDGRYKPETMYIEILKNRDGIAGAWDTLPYNGNTGRIG